MKLVAEIKLQGLPKTVNAIGYAHWATKRRNAMLWKNKIIQECVIKKYWGMNLEKAYLEFTRFSSKEPDFDNLVASFKHVMDGLVLSKVLIDDKSSIVGQPIFKWQYVPHKQGRIEIKIYTDG